MTELRPSDDVVFQLLDDEGVLVHVRTNRIYTLSSTGARFWELLVAGHDRAEIERRMLAEFDVEPDRLTAEVDALVASLADEGLVEEPR